MRIHTHAQKHQLSDDIFKKYNKRPDATEIQDTVTMVMAPGQNLAEGSEQTISVLTSIRTPKGLDRTPTGIV